VRRHASTYLPGSTGERGSAPRLVGLFASALLALVLLATAPAASASKQAVDFFGGTGSLGGQFEFGQFDSAVGVAVNNSGAGAGNQGDTYVLDPDNNRVERFGRNDNGTPTDPADDTFSFLSAWGADVDATPSGGSSYEICTVAAECQAAAASGGNGTQAGNGTLDNAQSVAVDQDTGEVYVSDAGNSRVNVYEGDGTFLRSFGYDVVQSGPDQVAAPSEQQQLTVKASGGEFSLFFEGQTTGAHGVGSVNSNSKLVTEVKTTSGTFAVGQAFSADGGLFPPGTTITAVAPGAITVSKAAKLGKFDAELIGDDTPHNASAAELETALDALPTIGGVGGSVTVSGGPGDETGSAPYTIEFGGSLGGEDAPLLAPTSANLTIGSGTASATVAENVKGGALEVCRAGLDVCKAGDAGAASGELGEPRGGGLASGEHPTFAIAVSQPDGNPSSGSVFVADAPNHRLDTYNLDGFSPSSIGSPAVFGERSPEAIAVDSRGIVYASNRGSGEDFGIERYDSQNANGVGVGFLAPIFAPADEKQQLTYSASAGQFKLSFDPDGAGPEPAQTTTDLPYNATTTQVEEALQALPAIGAGNVSVSQSVGEGLEHHSINFKGPLALTDVSQLVVSNGTTPLTGTIDVTTLRNGHNGALAPQPVLGLAVDPDIDGAGPDTEALYSLSESFGIQQFGPANAAGLTAPPSAVDDTHATNPALERPQGLSLDEATGRLYATAFGVSANNLGKGVYVFGETGPPPVVSLDSLSGKTTHSVIAHATINPNGPPDASYRFEYSTDGVKWTQTPTKLLGHQESPQAVEETIDPPPLGLLPNTEYQVRLVVQRRLAAAITTEALSFKTDPAKPVVETIASPIRSTTTAQLQGRVDPNGLATAYHFEYGNQGPCDANPCTATPDKAAGSGSETELAAENIEGLEPNTTYHYRIVADNAAPGAASAGEDETVSTRASDAPLTHGHFPGPPGSDRAYELVSLPDSGGNPVGFPLGFSDDGDHAAYSVAGGTPISEAGSFFGLYYSKRTPSGWQTSLIGPKRNQLVGPSWYGLYGNFNDFSSLSAINGGDTGTNKLALWHMIPDGGTAKLFEPVAPQEFVAERPENTFTVSADGSRTMAWIKGGTIDPAYPEAALRPNLYDVSSGSPHLADLMPGNIVSPCGGGANYLLSPDGSLLYFTACDGLYVRDLVAEETKQILIGQVSLLKLTPGTVFFTTGQSFDPEDSGGNDVYRYGTEAESFKCLTCLVPSSQVDVTEPVVSKDGSRLYFKTQKRLLPGAGPNGGIYSLDIATGKLTYVGFGGESEVFSRDGRFAAFASSSPALNPLGGAFTNGGTIQYYLYDDLTHSLECVSCPADGSPPTAGLQTQSNQLAQFSKQSANLGPLASDGTLAFATPTPLVGADQNTPGQGQNLEVGTDVYEWRDGRQLLVSDGLNNWSGGLHPEVRGISPSGRDIYFASSAQYTPDALDAFDRIYDARIGGGIEFPPPPKPCPLEVCQGTPKGAPEEQAPGTGTFQGPGNTTPSARCRKHRVRRRGRCVARHPKPRQHKRGNRKRRIAR
jgi:hypothetical protein